MTVENTIYKIKKSGWALKDGFRKSGPLGLHDGTYNEDYHFGYGTELDNILKEFITENMFISSQIIIRVPLLIW